MPLKSNKANASNNGHNKKDSILKLIFKRYNSEKITLDGVKNFFCLIFYKIGYEIENNLKIAWSYLYRALNKIYISIIDALKVIEKFLDKFTDTILEDLGEPLEKMASASHKISVIIKEARADSKRSTRKELKRYLKEGLEKNKELTKVLKSYMLPIISVFIFCLVIGTTLSKEYAISVLLDGEKIGTIKNYTVLENADKIITNKLVNTNDQTWQPNTSIKMVGLKKDSVIDERQLANNILSVSDENIVEATGLYVDGEFIGAVKDPTKLKAALTALKSPYENGNPNREVSFIQDVSVFDGIFFADTIVPDDELATLVSSEVSGAKYYTVVSGDSPWDIAVKNGITYNTLLSLNPNNDFSGLWPGDVVTVGASVPFLQVKYVERTTRQVEVGYDTKTEKNNSMSLGTTKVSQKGEKGLNEELVESTYIDGVLQNSKIIQTTVIKEPITEIVQQGTVYNGRVITGGSGKIIWPTGGGHVSRGFAGQYPAHNGLDIAAPIGTPIFAADTGVVIKAVYTNTGYGIYCIIEHGGYQTLYGHCSRLYVSAGQQVQKGQTIAAVGSTGNSTGPHLHFEVKKGNYRYNPYSWF